MTIFKRFVRDTNAATAVEYALIATGIAMAILAGVNALGTAVNTKFANMKTQLN